MHYVVIWHVFIFPYLMLMNICSDLCLVSAPSCFVTAEAGREEAAVTHWRPLMHTEGDHMTLINIYNAFIERTYTSASIT